MAYRANNHLYRARCHLPDEITSQTTSQRQRATPEYQDEIQILLLHHWVGKPAWANGFGGTIYHRQVLFGRSLVGGCDLHDHVLFNRNFHKLLRTNSAYPCSIRLRLAENAMVIFGCHAHPHDRHLLFDEVEITECVSQ